MLSESFNINRLLRIILMDGEAFHEESLQPLIHPLNKFFSTMFLKEMQIILISRFRWWL